MSRFGQVGTQPSQTKVIVVVVTEGSDNNAPHSGTAEEVGEWFRGSFRMFKLSLFHQFVVIANEDQPRPDPKESTKPKNGEHCSPAIKLQKPGDERRSNGWPYFCGRLIQSHDKPVLVRPKVQAKPTHSCWRVHCLTCSQQNTKGKQLSGIFAPGSESCKGTPEPETNRKRSLDTKAIYEPTSRNLQGGIAPEESGI